MDTYVLKGIVIHGKGQGRKVGMPTANLRLDEGIALAKDGVYASVTIVDGRRFMSMTNIGTRPSVDDNPEKTVETYILDFDEDIYDKHITVELKEYIRGVMKFPGGLEDVKRQVCKDIESIRGL